jgi:hypothetical protein
MIANEHFRQHPAIPIWDFGRVKGLPSKRGRTPSITGWNCPRIDPEAGNGTAETQERSTTDMRYLLLSGVAIIAALAITTPASAQRSGPGPGAQTGYGPRRLSARRVRPFLLGALQCAGCVSQSLRARRGTLGNNMADDDPIGRYNALCGLAAVTVVRRARLNTAPMGEGCFDRRPAHPRRSANGE